MSGTLTMLVQNDSDKDKDLDNELKIFDFSHYPVPAKTAGVVRIFYNNINGLEINAAINARVTNYREKKKHKIIKDKETYTKIESLIKQMYKWEVNITARAEPCIEWREIIPRTIITDIGKKYDQKGHWTVATSKSSVGGLVKPGGALIYNDGVLSGRMLEHGTDPWGYGRWAYKRYRRKKKHITVDDIRK